MSSVRTPKQGNRFRFRFVFVSCVRASGRGEAAWAREGCASSPLGLQVRIYGPARGHFLSKSCCYTRGCSYIFGQKFRRGARRLVFLMWVL